MARQANRTVLCDTVLYRLDGWNGVVKDTRSTAPRRVGGGICVFSPNENTFTPCESMVLMISELGGDSLATSFLAPVECADTSTARRTTSAQVWVRHTLAITKVVCLSDTVRVRAQGRVDESNRDLSLSCGAAVLRSPGFRRITVIPHRSSPHLPHWIRQYSWRQTAGVIQLSSQV